jgi:hypothetical protein
VKSLSWLGVASAYSFTTGAVIFIMRVTLL